MTCKLLPKWRNFAKSGHTDYDSTEALLTIRYGVLVSNSLPFKLSQLAAVWGYYTLSFFKNGPIQGSFCLFSSFPHDKNQYKLMNASIDGVLGTRTREAAWKVQTNPLSYGCTPIPSCLAVCIATAAKSHSINHRPSE